MPVFAAAARLARRAILPAALCGLAFQAAAQTATYDAGTHTLTLPSVTVAGGPTYTNVVLRLDNFAILGVGGVDNGGGGGVSPTCAAGQLTLAKYNAIAAGMTLAQVQQTMGCQYSAAATQRSPYYVAYTWTTPGAISAITVFFDPSGAVVQSFGGSFKVASGI